MSAAFTEGRPFREEAGDTQLCFCAPPGRARWAGRSGASPVGSGQHFRAFRFGLKHVLGPDYWISTPACMPFETRAPCGRKKLCPDSKRP